MFWNQVLLQPCQWPRYLSMLVEQTMLVPAIQSALLLLGMGADPSHSGFLSYSPPVQMHSLAVLAFSLFKMACKNFGVLKSILRTNDAYMFRKLPKSLHGPKCPFWLCGGLALVHCFSSHSLWFSHWGVPPWQVKHSPPLFLPRVSYRPGPLASLLGKSLSDPLNSTWKIPLCSPPFFFNTKSINFKFKISITSPV